VLLPVLDARCRYARGARYDESVWVETGVLAQGRASVHFGYRITAETVTGEVECAIGYTEHCMTDRDTRIVRPPAALAALLDRAPRVPVDLAGRLLAPVTPRGR
jgi:acyl-CoA thioester hydrolase